MGVHYCDRGEYPDRLSLFPQIPSKTENLSRHLQLLWVWLWWMLWMPVVIQRTLQWSSATLFAQGFRFREDLVRTQMRRFRRSGIVPVQARERQQSSSLFNLERIPRYHNDPFFTRYCYHCSSLSASNGDEDDYEKGRLSLDMTNLYQEWTLEQDQVLWNGYQNDKKSIIELAVLTGRGLRGVRARLDKLRDIRTPAYRRLFVPQQSSKQNQSKHNYHPSQDDAEYDDNKNKLVPVSEVLRRIQWDDHLNTSDFSIVHYDRVQNTFVESPVDAPNLNIKGRETRLVDALPEHRIFAIKFRQRIIWDRNRRIDLVFQGCGIQQVIDTYDQWKQQADEFLQLLELRKKNICQTLRTILGSDTYAQMEELATDFYVRQSESVSDSTNVADAPPTILVRRKEVETLVQQLRQLFRDARNDPTQSLESTLIPKTDQETLDLLSEWIILLETDSFSSKTSEHLKNLILREIDSLIDDLSIKNDKQQKKPKVPLPPLPELDEADLVETFVRGSGPGGQKINKTSNKVVLVHKPTQLRVECQDTRSLPQNRTIARKRLREKLDEFWNGRHSRVQIQREAIRKKKKARARNKQTNKEE